MTTEVLRNMIYARSSTLANLGFVVMDEVHYLADRFRGAVWEEVIIGLAESIQVIALSATVSNAEEFGEWLSEVRGADGGRGLRAAAGAAVPARAGRPDALRPVRRCRAHRPGVAAGGNEVNPALVRVARDESRYVRDDSRRPRGKGGRGRRTVSYGSGAYGGAAHRSRYRRLRPPAALAAQSRPAGDRRAAGPGGAVAGHHVHLLPRRLRGGGAPDARVGPAADQPGRAAGDRRDHRAAHRRAVRRRPAGVGLRPVRRGDDPRRSPPTTPGCCPRSRSASRRPSSAG